MWFTLQFTHGKKPSSLDYARKPSSAEKSLSGKPLHPTKTNSLVGYNSQPSASPGFGNADSCQNSCCLPDTA